MQKVLVTGGAGDVGSRLRPLMRGLYPEIVWSDRREPEKLAAGDSFLRLDLGDRAALRAGLGGVEGVVHLGGASVEQPWETILEANIIGTYNLFEAACEAGVKRVVFASTNHVVGFYPRHCRIGTEVTLRPDTRYGVSKAFGESLGALYAYKYGLSVTVLRIGNVDDEPLDRRRLAIWLQIEDLLQLIRIGLEHPDIRYEVFYGASDNERAWWDSSAARRFGYRPKHQSERHRDAALAREATLPPDPIGSWYQGGAFCSQEHDDERPLAER